MSSNSDQDKKKTVRVTRRRRSEEPGPEGRKRAEAPKRRRSDEQAAKPKDPGGSGGSSRPPSPRPLPIGGGLPKGLNPLLIVGLLVIVCVCVVPILLFLGPDDAGDIVSSLPTQASQSSDLSDSFDEEGSEAGAPETGGSEAPITSLEEFVPPSTSTEGQSWLVMLYQDADDKILEEDIYLDLNEAERVGSSDRVHIVSQVDRFGAGYQGDGNWSGTRRYYLGQDDDLGRVGSQLAVDLGEVNMSDGETLVDFVTWAVETFPADKHVLIMADHGMGWPGGWSDPDPGGRGDPSIPLASATGDQLFLMELDQALEQIRVETGLEQFELIGMDACLMGHLEVFSALAPHARYAVASQETEPALGWAYTGFLEKLIENPDMNGADLGRSIVDSYIRDDQRIVDDQARADMLRQGSPMGGLMSLLGGGGVSAAQLTQQMGENITLTAVDLAELPELVDSVNELSFNLQGTSQPIVAQARNYAQSYTSVFGSNVPPSYIDLGNFVQLLKRESADQSVDQAADKVLASLKKAVISEKHGPKKPGATGISIYFPNSQLYQSPLTGPESYTVVAGRFADASLWDDFLAYHYTGSGFEPTTGTLAVPDRETTITAPGAGDIEVSAITLSDKTAAPGQSVILSTDISGPNVGYVYLFVGFYDQDSNAIFVADKDFLESPDTRQVDGIYYPDWGDEESFTMAFEWEPLMFAISDGRDSVLAMLTPQSYGATYEDTLYTVDGTYTYADGGETRYARLYFRDGTLQQVFGFNSQSGTGAPREIIPQSGDTFTVQEKWMDLDQNGKVVQVATQEGGTLTFSDQMFTWETLDAAQGKYIVGFIVEDLDGNSFEVFEEISVE